MGNRLDNEVAIVTGASKGIGKAVAKLYAEQGAKVLLVFRADSAAAQKTIEEIKDTGGQASLFQGDVSRKADTDKMAEEVVKRYGRIDILCANAGIYPSAMIKDMTVKDWDEVLSVNLKGTFLSVKACLPYMQRQKYGKIVAIASITGPSTGLTGMAHYGASKSGIIGFVRTAALEFVRYNITINAISPGMVLTEGIKAILDEKRIREIEREIPMKKMADPVDVAYAALFLSTDESKYITGQSIVVDGGLTLPELPFRSIDWE